jgi:predicted MPP superfamily phosphohydrolase
MPKKRLVWLTDIHLNFVELDRVEWLLDQIERQRPDAVLIGGDIAESHDVGDWLLQIDDRLSLPVYFVLGNHDYYHSSIARVREAIGALCCQRPRLHFLTTAGVHSLSPQTAVIGHDGWCDARAGDYDTSTIVLNDYLLIEELKDVGRQRRREILQRLGDEAADHIRVRLLEALPNHARVILLTHPPPMQEACWYQGRTSDDNWAPHFTCAAMGHAILEIMPGFPDRRLTVLCGHTHSPGVYRPLENVEVITGGAEYGDPRIVTVLEVD